MILLTINYGLRRGEVLCLIWQDIDFESGNIFICNTRVRVKEIIEKQPKSESSLRTLPLMPQVEGYLRKLQKQRDEDKRLMGNCYTDSGYVCRNRDGLPINMDSCNSIFKRILKNNNLPNIRLHDLRHCTASLLLKNGASMKDIQVWLGHSDIGTTMNIYAHVDYEMKKATARLMSGMNFAIN
jgi:integrase